MFPKPGTYAQDQDVDGSVVCVLLRLSASRPSVLLLLMLAASWSAGAAESPTMPATVPPELVIVRDGPNLFIHERLNRDYATLAERYAVWIRRALAFNAKYGDKSFDDASPEAAQGQAEQRWLAAEADDYETLLVHFELSFAKLLLDYPQYIVAMNAMAKRLGFPGEKLTAVNLALNRLTLERQAATAAVAKKLWDDIRSRDGDPDLARAAGAGVGPALMPAAGQQSFDDCAIFALANATGEPYGVVAARANRLLADAEWRGAADRRDPQRAIKEHGLIGGEVVLMAEVFGKSEVITSAAFPGVLKDGRPILACVVTSGSGRHQVVLSRTFTHGGETWYEMMDSGSPQRRHVRATELDLLLCENGVAFARDLSRVPRIPGAGGDHAP